MKIKSLFAFFSLALIVLLSSCKDTGTGGGDGGDGGGGGPGGNPSGDELTSESASGLAKVVYEAISTHQEATIAQKNALSRRDDNLASRL